MGPRVLLAASFLALILADCSEQTQEGQQESPEQGTQGGQPVTTERTTQVATGGDRVSVGGFSVEGPGGAETTLGSVDVGDGFTKREGAFLTEGAQSGETPVLAIRAGVRLGSLRLRAT